MKTFIIESKYESMFKAYETIAVTDKGIMRTRCIQLDKETACMWADEDNRRVPFYDTIFNCIIYKVRVDEITICVR